MLAKKKHTLKRLTIPPDTLKKLCATLGKTSQSLDVSDEKPETTLQEMQFVLQLDHCEKEIKKLAKFKHVIAAHLHGYFDQHPFRFIFFQTPGKEGKMEKPATCVRWPVVPHEPTSTTTEEPLPSYKLEIHSKESYKQRKIEARVAYDADDDDMVESGMFITDDGTVVVMRPEAGYNVDVVVPGNPGDAASNYKCLT